MLRDIIRFSDDDDDWDDFVDTIIDELFDIG